MRRFLLAVLCLALASPLWAAKTLRVPKTSGSPLAPVVNTISGSPLTIAVGNDTSMQVTNSNVPGTGQFYPPDCSAGETADSGVFINLAGTIYGPDFNNHPCGSASNSYTPWTPVSMTPVTGTGTAGDPFTVVIVADAGASVRLTETLTYVNGAGGAGISLSFAQPPAPVAPQGGIGFDAFLAGDLYLADNDQGFGLLQGSSVGGRGANASCAPLQYVILLGGATPSNRHAAEGYSTVWDEISAGSLSNTVDSICEDNGAGLEWTGLATGGQAISTGVSFTGSAVALATVPTLSSVGLAALILMLAAVGYVLARKMSPGA